MSAAGVNVSSEYLSGVFIQRQKQFFVLSVVLLSECDSCCSCKCKDSCGSCNSGYTCLGAVRCCGCLCCGTACLCSCCAACLCSCCCTCCCGCCCCSCYSSFFLRSDSELIGRCVACSSNLYSVVSAAVENISVSSGCCEVDSTVLTEYLYAAFACSAECGAVNLNRSDVLDEVCSVIGCKALSSSELFAGILNRDVSSCECIFTAE